MNQDSKENVRVGGNRLGGRLAAMSLIAGGLSALTNVPANAHPGHRLTDAGAAHLFTSPDHLLMLAGAALAIAIGAHWVRQPKVRRTMQIGAVLTSGMALALWLR